MTSQEKCEIYAKYSISLKKAMRYEFWMQAVFIEYAILEDRTESVLRHAGDIKLVNSRGKPLKLSEKLNKIESHSKFTDKRIRKYLSLDLIKEIRAWKAKRDLSIHGLMNSSADDVELESIAVEGEQLIRIVDNKVKSVNRIFDKQQSKE